MALIGHRQVFFERTYGPTIYIVRACDGEISISEMYCVLCNFTWSLTLREERKLRVFENMVLRRIFGPRRDEVTGE